MGLGRFKTSTDVRRYGERQQDGGSQSSVERGVAMVEFALTLPLLVVCFFGLLETSLHLMNYFQVNRIGYDGVRFMISQPGLEERIITNPSAPPPIPTVHARAINRMLTFGDAIGLKRERFSIEPEFGDLQTGDGTGVVKKGVRVNLKYRSTGIFSSLNLQVEVTGGFLRIE